MTIPGRNDTHTAEPSHVPDLRQKTRDEALREVGDLRLHTLPKVPPQDWKVAFQQPPRGTEVPAVRGGFFVAAIDEETAKALEAHDKNKKLDEIPELTLMLEGKAREALGRVPLCAWIEPPDEPPGPDWQLEVRKQQPPPGTSVPDPQPPGYFVGVVLVMSPNRRTSAY